VLPVELSLILIHELDHGITLEMDGLVPINLLSDQMSLPEPSLNHSMEVSLELTDMTLNLAMDVQHVLLHPLLDHLAQDLHQTMRLTSTSPTC